MEWFLANWELVIAAVSGLFYLAEKLVKQSKKTGWNDILIDGIKWLAGKGRKKGNQGMALPECVCVLCLLVWILVCVFPLFSGCARHYMVRITNVGDDNAVSIEVLADVPKTTTVDADATVDAGPL